MGVETQREKREAALTAQFSLFLTVFINSGVIYMSRFSSNPQVGTVLLCAEGGLFLSYLLSRTRFYRIGALAVLSILVIIPLFNTLLSQDHSPLAMVTLLIWNSMTIIIAAFFLSLRFSVLFYFLNLILIASFPFYVKDMDLTSIVLPLLFNGVIPFSVIILANHIKILEVKQLEDSLEINRRLERELNNKNIMEKQLLHNATHDSLTKLPNRMILQNRIGHVINYRNRHPDLLYALLFLNLDRFKNINDDLGHTEGDYLLFEVGARLKESVREQDTVTRLGSDEFVILLEEVKDPSEIFPILQRIREKLTEPMTLNDRAVHMSASVGVVVGQKEYTEPYQIIRNAAIAMDRAKKTSGFSFEFFDKNMVEKVQSKLDLESDLRQGLEREEFTLFYQPIIHTDTLAAAGFEALIRWHDSRGNFVSPGDFIPMAEETGLIIPMGYWIIEKVCRQVKIWQERHLEHPFAVSINLSNKQFQDSGFIEKVREIIERNGVDPRVLKFELTESLIVKNSRETKDQLNELREMGCQILIDDFGTGYSSLSYLHTLPIDILKIDRSFINRISDERGNIVNTIINLAHSLNMIVVAEGVETPEQFEILKEMKCELIQGYYFSKPVDAGQAGEFLK
ncbi:MAG: EAL domain-containing protein [Spirochaetales bacterium]|nr:EAL domain-containing protein [Spirochaetales bacterium]